MYKTLLVVTLMGSNGPMMERVTEHPSWDACVRAELQVQREAQRKNMDEPPAPRLNMRQPVLYKKPRIVAYCRQK